jgi:hypothetical protein
MDPRSDLADAVGAPPPAAAPVAPADPPAPGGAAAPDVPASPPVLGDAALATRVAAWHNRHPLALRITPAMVQGMGIVAVPVLGAGGGVRPASSENFIAPVTPRQAAAFAARHGTSERPELLPLREVAADTAGAAQWRYVRTAAIETSGQRVRVLVAPRAGGRGRPAVLGPRLWSLQRTLVASALGGAAGTALVGLLAAVLWWPRSAPPDPRPDAPLLAAADAAASGALDARPVAPSASSPEPAASAVSLHADGSVAEASPAAPSGVAEAAAPAASSTVAAAAGPARAASAMPVDGDDPGAAPSDIVPRLNEQQRAEARRIGRLMRGEAEAAEPPASAPPAADGRHYALVTRITRGRAASQVMQSLMASAAAGAALPGQPRTEVVQVKDGWRAIWWPFTTPADAGRASAALAAYGIEAELVEF